MSSHGGARTRAWTTRRHFSEHVACSEVGKVGAKLGWLWADLDLDPKSKVATQEQIYKFHLGAMIISVVD